MKSGTLPKVVFYKTRPTPLTIDNYKSIVNVMSMNGAANEVFLKSVQNVRPSYFHVPQFLFDSSKLHPLPIRIPYWKVSRVPGIQQKYFGVSANNSQ